MTISTTNRNRVNSNAPPPAPISAVHVENGGDYFCRICGQRMNLPDRAIPIGRSKFGFRMYQIGREVHDLKKSKPETAKETE